MSADDESLFVALHARIEDEVQKLKKEHEEDVSGSESGSESKDNNEDSQGDKDLLVRYSKLLRYARDIEGIRVKVYRNDRLDTFNRKLHVTDRDIQNTILDIELRIEKMRQKAQAQAQAEEELESKKTGASGSGNAVDGEVVELLGKHSHDDYEAKESIESLRSRLLSTSHNQLDQVQSVEVQNNYHDSLQQELIESLPSMVSSLKEQALQFQEMIKQDAVILKEATQNFETSHGRFDNVNTLLSKYHKEGRLGFWFYIRITSMVLVSFLFLLIIIRLIPARH